MERENESLNNELSIYRSKYNFAEEEIEKLREDYAKLEIKNSIQKDDIDTIIKENNQLNRTKTELMERIETLTKTHINQEKEWMNKEKNLLTNIKDTKTNNRELRRRSLFLDMQLQEAISEIPEKDDLENLKETIYKQEKSITGLKYDLEITKDVLLNQTEKEKVQEEEIEKLKMYINELEETKAQLSEENDSYQILLKEKTLSGELMNHPFMQAFDKISESEITLSNSEENSQSKDVTLCDELSDVQNLSVFDKSDPKIVKYEEEIKNLKDQTKALTLYLRNVIQKMMSDPHLEEVEDTSFIKDQSKKHIKESIRKRRSSSQNSTIKNRISSFFS